MGQQKTCTTFQKKLQLRREKVRKLRIECQSTREIARRLKEPLSNIRRDMEYFDRQYREALPHKGPHTLAEELDRLRYLESEAWKAWRRSQRPATIETSGIEEGGEQTKSKAQKVKRSQVGDRHFLELIEQFAVRRSQLQHMKEVDNIHGPGAYLQFEQICQGRNAITEFMERFSSHGGIQDVYACAIRQDSEPRSLEVSATFSGVRSSPDGPGVGAPIEIDCADAAPTWEI